MNTMSDIKGQARRDKIRQLFGSLYVKYCEDMSTEIEPELFDLLHEETMFWINRPKESPEDWEEFDDYIAIRRLMKTFIFMDYDNLRHMCFSRSVLEDAHKELHTVSDMHDLTLDELRDFVEWAVGEEMKQWSRKMLKLLKG